MGDCSDDLASVMRDYELPLLRYVAALLRDPEAARDVVQETFLKYLDQRQGQGAPLRHVRAWLYRVAHNQALDYLRHQRHQTPLDEETAQQTPAAGRDPAATTAARDAETAAWQALEVLSDRDRQIVLLKVIEGKSYQEIADLMDISTSNVGFILHTALKKLATTLHTHLA
jgi:RNA polymerase sigma-70 factor (ECF subfamily)